jgi:hypothetical protein
MAVVISRRGFLLSWFVQNRPATVEVEVMEAFSTSGGPSALLVHHATEAERNAFGVWLRTHDGALIVCRLPAGTAVHGQIFRVKMCFGRGLILTRTPVAIRPKDVLHIN